MANLWNNRYRAVDFDSYVGNTTLKKQFQTLLERDKLPQMIMLHGPAGTGKTSMARLVAMSLVCEHQEEGLACGECESCKALTEEYIVNGRGVLGIPVFDKNITNMNTVEDAEKIIEEMQGGYGFSTGNKRIYVIDEIQEASIRAQNTYLKITEEPIEGLYIIMCTTHPQKIIPALKSRLHSFNVRKPTVAELVERLEYICKEEGVNYTKAGLRLLVSKLNRVPRDVINRAETLASLGDITREAVEESLGVLDFETYVEYLNAVKSGRITESREVLAKLQARGMTVSQFVTGFGEFLVDAVKVKNVVELENYTSSELRVIRAVSKDLSDEDLMELMTIVSDFEMARNDLSMVNYYALTGKLQTVLNPKDVQTEVAPSKAIHNFKEVTKKVEKAEKPSEDKAGERVASEEELLTLFSSTNESGIVSAEAVEEEI